MNKKLISFFIFFILLLTISVSAKDPLVGDNNQKCDKGFKWDKDLGYCILDCKEGTFLSDGKCKKEYLALEKDDTHYTLKFKDKFNSELNEVQIKDKINGGHNYVGINTKANPELNIPATITFKNTGLINPIALHNGKWVPYIIPQQVSGDTYSINVPGFSNWSLVDTTWNGTFNQTTLWNGKLGLDVDAVLLMNLDFDTQGNNQVFNSFVWKDDNDDGVGNNWTAANGGGLSNAEIVTGNGFNGNAQRIERSVGGSAGVVSDENVVESGKTYFMSLKYRTSGTIVDATSLYDYGTIPTNTGSAKYYNTTFTATGTGTLNFFCGVTNMYFEIDNIILKEVSSTYYNKTVVRDYSYYENNGTIARKWTNGIVGNSLYFDGVNDYVTLGNTMNFEGNQNMTISLWMKVDDIVGVTPVITHDSNGVNKQFYIDVYLGKVRWKLADMALATSDDSILADTWYNLIMIKNGTESYLYINGALFDNESGVGNFSATTTDFLIGARSLSTWQYYEGLIDEVKIYNKTLTPTQISDLYNNESAGNRINITGIIAEYRLDEESGDVAKDTIGINNGTLNGYTRPYYSTAGISGGAFEFDGVDDYMTVSEIATDEKGAYSIWFKFNNNGNYKELFTDGIGGNNQRNPEILITSANHYSCTISNGVSFKSLTTDYALTPNIWYHSICMWDNTNDLMSIYINNILIKNESIGFNPSRTSLTGDRIGYFNPPSYGYYFDGLIDEVKIFNRSLSEAEILDLYNNYSDNLKWKYYRQGDYVSEVYNASSYITQYTTNVWLATVFDTDDNILAVWGRADNCSNISSSGWTLGVKTGDNYLFDGEQGECFQYALYLEGEGSEITEYSNVTITAFRVPIANVTNISIKNYPIYTTNTMWANATFSVNGTDEGAIFAQWYVNSTGAFQNIYQQNFYNLENEDSIQTTLPSTYFVKGDQVYVRFRPTVSTAYGNSTGDWYYSETRTINNSNFTFTYTPTKLNFSIYAGADPIFRVYITDVDGDVNTTWNTTSLLSPYTQSGSGTSFTLDSEQYIVGDEVYVQATLTDGEYTESVSWTVNVDEGVRETQGEYMGMIFGLFIAMLVFGLLGWKLGDYCEQNYPGGYADMAVRIFGYGVAAIQFLIIMFIVYAKAYGLQYITLLKLDFYIIMCLIFGIGMISLITLMIRLVSPSTEDKELDYR